MSQHVVVSPSECPVTDCSCDCYTENKTAKGKKLMAGAGTTAEVNGASNNSKLESKSVLSGKSPKRFQEIQKIHGGKTCKHGRRLQSTYSKRLNEALADIAETASSRKKKKVILHYPKKSKRR